MSDLGVLAFPCVYTFKIFGRRSDTFVERVCAILGATLGPIPFEAVKVRTSAQGRYVSLTVDINVATRAQLERVYVELRAEPEVLLYI
jgi:hypothetical protein